MKLRDILTEAKMKKPNTVEEVYEWLVRNCQWLQQETRPLQVAKTAYLVNEETLEVDMAPEMFSSHSSHNDRTAKVPSFNNNPDDQDLYTTLPVKFGKLNCMHFEKNNVTSFKNFPREVLEYFSIKDNPIHSLVGIPDSVGSLWLISLPLAKIDALPSKIDELMIRECENISSLQGVEHNNEITSFRLYNLPKLKTIDYLPPKTMSMDIGEGIELDNLSGLDKLAPNLYSINFGNYHGEGAQVKGSILSLLKFKDLDINNYGVTGKFKDALEIVKKHLHTKDIGDCQEELIDAGLEEYAKL